MTKARAGRRRKAPPQQKRKPARRLPLAPQTYWDSTKRPLQCLLFLLPMVIAYELGMIAVKGEFYDGQRSALAARQILYWLFNLFGVTGYYLPGLALIAVLFVQHLASRDPWRVAPQPLLGMAGESVLLALPLLLLNQWLPSLQAVYAPGPSPTTSFASTAELDNLLLSIGAGLYEELVFRLIVITLITLVLTDLARIRQGTSMALAVIVSSLLFAAHHYHPIGADPWSSKEFAFRAAAGGYLACVFVLRGFGLAVGCHVIYDVMAFLS